ncbi:MAG: efflux RND transporter periplasmic adaptor subunit [Myxococcales bacterium]|nr:efflux RND transporter periplasmic adaptor subunit [Myxococcales bacterium]
MTLTLTGPEQVEARVDAPLRPGIFRPTLTAPRPGTYAGALRVTGPQARDTIDGFEIVVQPAEAHHADDEAEAGPEPISFLKEQQWQVPFATAFARAGALDPTIEVPGEVATPPRGQAEVSAAISGRVVAAEGGLPTPGQQVTRGQLLASIAPAPSSPEQGANTSYAVTAAEARVETARAALARAERLIADRAIPQRQVDEARRELGVAQKAVRTARRARGMFSGAVSGRGGGSYRLTAPIDGVVVDVHASDGMTVTVGDPLVHIIDLRELWIRARVPEQDAAAINPTRDAAYTLLGARDWTPLRLSGEQPTAALVTVGRTVDPTRRTVDVIYSLNNETPDERLRVGAMARVAVPAGPRWEGVIVPRDAVLDDDGRSVVYVQVEGEAFEERAVRLGPQAGGELGIEQGVAAGERVVTRGAAVIRLSERAGSAPAHGHVH